MSKNYNDLEVYKLSFELFIQVHQFSFELPKYETYELGSQIRRSADSINSNIVEGYGRRKYKRDFIKFLIYSYSSNCETINHLKKIELLYPKLKPRTELLLKNYDTLGAQLHRFIDYVEKNWKT